MCRLACQIAQIPVKLRWVISFAVAHEYGM